ncbi:hypothetical protein KBC31_04250 [Candidatus Saccharibacteria bacterium]|nr:hypothetical protein [Candidatus Saccharibacteria bacterium]
MKKLLIGQNFYKPLISLFAAAIIVINPWFGVASQFIEQTVSAAATLTPCVSTTPVHSTSLGSWNTGETRTTGHNELTPNGLRVWTESNTTTDKAAGYRPASFNLADLGNGFGLTSIGTGATPPSLQLTVDLDGNGTPEGNLVAEPAAYGSDTLWLSSNWTSLDISNAPTTVNGGGTGKGGGVNAWLAAFPNAKILAIGYSLGSGVKGDFVITKITAGCSEYTFAAAPVNTAPTVTVANPAENSFVSTVANSSKLRARGSFKDDSAANYLQFELVRNGNLVTVYTMHYNDIGLNSDGTFEVNIPVNSNIENGDYSLFYTGTDFEGGITDRMERKFKIDNTAPSTPNITKPSARQWFKTAPIASEWTASTDGASGVARYQVAYRYADGHTFGGSTCAGEAIDGAQLSGCRDTTGTSRAHNPDSSEQGGVTIWVRAIDNTGNTSPWSSSVSYNYDSTAPVTDIVVENLQDNLVSGTFTISGDASDNLALNRVYLQLVSRQDSQRYGGTTINLIPDGTQAHWSKTYNINNLNLPDGKYAAHVSVVDMAGNTSSAGWTDDFMVDSTAPAAPTNLDWRNSAGISATSTSDQNGTASWQASSSTDVAKYVYRYWNDIPGNQYKEATPYSSDVNGTSLAGSFNQGQGVHHFCVIAVDAAGNQSACSQTFTIDFDTTNPVVTIADQTSASATPTITGNASDATSVTANVNGVDYIGTPSENGDFSFVIDELSNGSYLIMVTATDSAGNESQATATLTVAVVPANNGGGETSNNGGNGSNGNGSSNTAPTTSQAATAPLVAIGPLTTNFARFGVAPNQGLASILGNNDQQGENGEVLGAKDDITKDDNLFNKFGKADVDDGDVLGADNEAFAKVLGLQWPWWIAIVAGVLALWWLLLAAKRRRKDDDRIR